MTDWQQATEDQIRRAIAERLGYKAELVGKGLDELGYEYVEYAVSAPNNERIGLSSPYLHAESKGIDMAYKDAIENKRLSDWPNDANAALTLPFYGIWHISKSLEFWEVVLTNHGTWNHPHAFMIISAGQHFNLAMAACIAWLSMKDSEQK